MDRNRGLRMKKGRDNNSPKKKRVQDPKWINKKRMMEEAEGMDNIDVIDNEMDKELGNPDIEDIELGGDESIDCSSFMLCDQDQDYSDRDITSDEDEDLCDLFGEY